MDIEVALQKPGGKKAARLAERLAASIKSCGADEVNAAAAYVTVEGVNALLEAWKGKNPAASRWLVGLDDAISQPGAIDLLRSLPNAKVKVVTFAATGARFHTKMFHFANTQKPEKSFLVIGSANLSRAALEKNAEAVVFSTSRGKAEAESLRQKFDEVWKLGHFPSAVELQKYKARYDAARALRKKLDGILLSAPPGKGNAAVSPDEVELDPSLAKTCWIECGAVTLRGRELELKGIQARFFGLNPTGGASAKITLISHDGVKHPTPFNYRAKTGMWRVLFPSSIKEVKAGLRPQRPDGSLARSPYVAVFKKAAAGNFKLTFLDDKSTDYLDLKSRSEQVGAIGQTRARSFGWF